MLTTSDRPYFAVAATTEGIKQQAVCCAARVLALTMCQHLHRWMLLLVKVLPHSHAHQETPDLELVVASWSAWPPGASSAGVKASEHSSLPDLACRIALACALHWRRRTTETVII